MLFSLPVKIKSWTSVGIMIVFVQLKETDSKDNSIRDILFDLCSAAAWVPVKEKAFLFAASAERPADIFIPNYSCFTA